MVNSVEIVKKLNFVKSSRFLKSRELIEEHMLFPQNEQHEADQLRNAIFTFLKKKFVGCHLRVNNNSISMRLSGSIHIKAEKLREIFDRETEWRSWFENNHRNIYQTWRNNRSNWNNGYVQISNRDGMKYIHVPYVPNRIYNYFDNGIVSMLQFMIAEQEHDERLAAVYDDAIRLMEEEVARKERERRERIERELNEYLATMKSNLYFSATELQESSDPTDKLFAEKILAWARENGKAPEYVVEAGYKQMAPVRTKVQVMNQANSQEENWYVVPVFEGFEVPEGFELQEGWGLVTKHDPENERSRRGVAPIVVEEYIYLSFDMEHWKHLLPEGYAELLEVSNRLRKEAEEEAAPLVAEAKRKEVERKAEEEKKAAVAKKLEEEARKLAEKRAAEEAERIRQQVEEERARRREEEARTASERRQHEEAQARRDQEAYEAEQLAQAEAAERRARLAEQLRQQVTQTEVAYVPPQVIPTDERATATENGIYRNMRAIPLERYVVIRQGVTQRFRDRDAACIFAGVSDGDSVTIRDYHAPHDAVESYIYSEELPF